ncbi:MAG: NAD(P)/FAD-dependent oxidoreductase [Phycisphaerales bacterium]
MSVSLWQRAERPEVVEADLAIVGAGIAGLSGALEASRLGQRVVVLERGAGPGAGASGRNAGFLMRGAADNYARAVRELGRERARELWRFTEQNLADLRSEGLERVPGYAARGSCLLALEADEGEELRESLALLRADGFAGEDLRVGAEAGDDVARAPGVVCGLINPDDAVCHPVRLIEWIASMLPHGVLRTGADGGQVHEIVPVSGSGAGSDGLVVRTDRLEVRAARALVCANAWIARLIPALRGVVVPNRGQMLALEAPAEALRIDHAYYANHGGEYFRRVNERTVILGGCRRHREDEERTDSDEPTPAVQAELERFGERVFGRSFPVGARWAGTMAFTPDHLPLTGPAPGVGGGRVWVCGGFTGHGMSLGFRTARLTVRAMLDAERVDDEAGPFPVSRLASGGRS